ncbi:ATP synthase subunit delta, mitochondrial [Petaurus breviceps papuanus]|uniref:ATP synthase subunit delta, mitochondrial n=1 Tax=Petaurus breviceps papuanus TaxID=3040969 RepID=UPI0036D8DAB6
MLPTTLLRRCGLRLLRQARVPAPASPPARAYAEAAPAAAAAVPGQMSFTFASPTQVYFNEANVKQVDVPTQSGAFGILAAHVPTLQVLKPGVVTVHAEDGTTTKYFVSSGSVTVNADSSVQLLAEEAVALDMLDLAAARSNLEKAHSDLSGASDEAARAEVQIRIEANEAIVKALE